MRLINARTKVLETFSDGNIPTYAILSHTWAQEDQEISFQDAQHYKRIRSPTRRRKLEGSCAQAVKDGLDYVWIDTCCINRDSSAELSEAINSMFRWYADASTCYVYLSDVDALIGQQNIYSAINQSRWVSRGWTLQELLAPKNLEFYCSDWSFLGTKERLCKELVSSTGIPRQFLLGMTGLHEASVAQKMSWAAKRSTTRKEDRAYCLLGLFGIYMPMIYGEGDQAFIRLQEEIMRRTKDDSILAWGYRRITLNDLPRGALATSPADFYTSGRIVPSEQKNEVSDPIQIVVGDVQLKRGIYEDKFGHTFIVLHCRPNDDPDRVVAIPVTKSASTGPSHRFERLGNRDLSLLSVSNSKTPPTVLLLPAVNEQDETKSTPQFIFDIRNSAETFLKLAEVEPRKWWNQKGDTIKPTIEWTCDDICKICIRLTPVKEKESDVLIIMAPQNQDSNISVKWHVMICSQTIKLDTVLHNFNFRNPDAPQEHSVNNGGRILHVGIYLEPVGSGAMFFVQIRSTDWSKEETVDILHEMGSNTQIEQAPQRKKSLQNGRSTGLSGGLSSRYLKTKEIPCDMFDYTANNIVVKAATIDDLDDLTKIAQAGFPDDPEFDYRFPYRQAYPEDNWLWTRTEYEGYLNQPDKYAVLLAAMPANESSEKNGDHQQGSKLDRSRLISVALAVWDLAVTVESQVGDVGIDQRQDADRMHMLEYANALSSAFELYFAKLSANQVHLRLLTTHPDYRHRGAGTALCRWGLQLAQQRGQPVTVIASRMGQMLYEHLCFHTLGTVVIQAPGEEEQVQIACLEWQPKQFDRGACTIQ